MNYNPTLAGAAALAATTFYPLNPTEPDLLITGSVGSYRFEMPALITVRGNYSFGSLQTPTKQSEQSIESEFPALAQKWKEETGFHSSLSEKFMHPSYQRIMAMGKPALPLILRDLEQNSAHWFYALRFIVDSDMAVGTKTVSEARAAWLKWGYENGYI
jgi:hypothetical protein